uniref:RANBP2-like and GRIP domain-containing protein 5/6 n=1 Tax=Phallusia mammillata TaxID=59560 RepID=A0A6F9DQU2_9ASCI|nr:RANBP2-like and GRIP domain-containing protein 5/6 [Phallusia mammillata]
MPSMSVSEVSSIVQKAIKNSNPRELPLKGLHFGQLWHEAGDYQNASQWITKYLRAYDRDPQAHRLLGECYEKLSEYELALKCYKQSLHIKPYQPQLVLHIVELFLNPGPTQNPNRAQVWLDKAAAALPGNPNVFKLKMELLVAQQASPATLEKAIKEEMKLRDNDFSLHEEYISFLKTQGNISAANAYINDLDNIQSPHSFCNGLEWCACIVSTYQDYYDNKKAKSTSAHELLVPRFLLLEALARYLLLCISDKNFEKSFQLLQQLDEVTYVAASQSISGEWHIVEEEMKAQLAWLSATLMLHQVDMNQVPSLEGRGLCGILYAYSLSKPVPGLTTAWAVNCRRAHTNLPSRLMRNAGMRISECSHMVHILEQGNGIKNLLQNINMDFVGQNVCRYLWPETHNAQCSFLWNSKAIARNRVTIPPIDDMLYFDQISSSCANLHNIVWLGVRWCKLDHPSDFLPWVQQLFPKLRLASNTDVKSGALVLSTGLLDIEAFVASCVYTTEKQIEVWSETYQDQKRQSFESPPTLIRKLTTESQEKWWQAAMVLSAKEKPKQSAAELSKMKPLLLRGLESIRGIGNHGLQTVLATKLAKYFESKAFLLREEGGISSGWFAYQRRAAVYWSLVLPDLQRATEGRVLHKPKTKDALFPEVFQEPKCDDASSLLSDANMCHGELSAEENRIEDALTFYGKATMPQASFCQAHIYKKLSENAIKSSLSQNPLSDGEKQKEIYFKKYKHCLEVTLTRLQQHPDDKLHERTVSLLAGLQMTPPRPAVDKSNNESILPGPSKQSTPKLDDSVMNSVLSSLVEKDSVTNLVDSLATLTSAVSSLKLEMGQLREESKVRQYSASPSFTSQAHATPQRVVHPEHLGNLAMPMTPPMYQTMQDGIVRPAPVLTPQRSFIPQQSSMYPSVGRDGRISTPAETSSYINAYQQQQQQLQQQQLQQQQLQQQQLLQQQAQLMQQQAQQQAVYTPIASSAYYSNYQYQSYTPEAMINGHTVPTMATPQAYTGAAYTPEPKPANSGYNQQANVLAACLQNKASTDALQQRLGSALAGITSSPVSAPAKPQFQPQTQPQIQPPSNASLTGNQRTTSVPTDTSQQVPTTKGGQSSLIQQLLQSDTSSKPTPQVPKKDVDFLSKFVTPKSGIEHKFQSPEQMDRENQELEALENADNDTSNNNDTGPHFEPIVSLPEVETVTGEEDEEVLFLERCRLFRWDDEQWKERGVGDMKVLRHKSTNKSRLVMRRDQVHKVCCNHFISRSLTLTPMETSERALVWTAFDFADGESKNEQLAARFKTSEVANKFKNVVSKEASKASSAPDIQMSSVVAKEPSAETGENKQPIPTTQKSTPSSIAAAASTFKFVMPKPSELEEKSTAAPRPETSKPSVFTGLAGALTEGFAGAGPEGGIKPAPFKFSFGAPKPKMTPEPEIVSAAAPAEVTKPDDETSHETDDHNQSDGPHFAPKIDLPDLVEAKTGEEDEEVLFCHRAKLYRFNDSQWKERGVGDIKVLKHKLTAKYRIVMRREQVLKLCANHYITGNMQLKPHGTNCKAWTWVAQDFSDIDDQPQKEMFVVRFGNVDSASSFKEQVDLAANCANEQPTLKQPTSPSRAATAFIRKESQQQQVKPFGIANTSSNNANGNNLVTKPSNVQSSTPVSKPPTTQTSEMGIFSKPSVAGSWDCPDCMIKNPPSANMCQCCGASNPSAAESTQTTETKPSKPFTPTIFGAPSTSSTFSFGVKPGQTQSILTAPAVPSQPAESQKGVLSKPKAAGSWNCPDCMVNNPPSVTMCQCCGASNPTAADSTQATETKPSKPFAPSIFGAPSTPSTFSFGVKPGQVKTFVLV